MHGQQTHSMCKAQNQAASELIVALRNLPQAPAPGGKRARSQVAVVQLDMKLSYPYAHEAGSCNSRALDCPGNWPCCALPQDQRGIQRTAVSRTSPETLEEAGRLLGEEPHSQQLRLMTVAVNVAGHQMPAAEVSRQDPVRPEWPQLLMRQRLLAWTRPVLWLLLLHPHFVYWWQGRPVTPQSKMKIK